MSIHQPGTPFVINSFLVVCPGCGQDGSDGYRNDRLIDADGNQLMTCLNPGCRNPEVPVPLGGIVHVTGAGAPGLQNLR